MLESAAPIVLFLALLLLPFHDWPSSVAIVLLAARPDTLSPAPPYPAIPRSCDCSTDLTPTSFVPPPASLPRVPRLHIRYFTGVLGRAARIT
ncbi:hypothetical protein BCR39DRAFT_555278 [Naematelia encephala]|uniref:Secreted protein n=1 Tax=Naematelia encephala TaxID=71784 RepID=A0A1Y2AEX3_9TREE|nr:hypothetical protein BCR39DRAFT_555278 [Naematelia encephala]